MRILFAVKSCKNDAKKGCHDAIRETWGRDLPDNVDLRFFSGVGNYEFSKPGPKDEILLVDVADDYDSLPYKTRGILRYSIATNYDFTFLCDNDTFIIPRPLLDSGFEHFDYSGRFGSARPIGTTFPFTDGRGNYEEHTHPWASGMGYFMSEKAAKIIYGEEPKTWAEDMFVGQTLGPLIQQHVVTAGDLPIENVCMWHFPTRMYTGHPYDPNYGWMKTMQRLHHDR